MRILRLLWTVRYIGAFGFGYDGVMAVYFYVRNEFLCKLLYGNFKLLLGTCGTVNPLGRKVVSLRG